MNFREYINESVNIQSYQNKIIDYVGKFGNDKKLIDLSSTYKKIKIIKSTPEELIIGTDAKSTRTHMPKDINDAKEEMEFEEEVLNKNIKDYNNQLKFYYDSVYEMKFIGEVDSFRKTLNSIMKSIANFIVSVDWYKEHIK